MLERRIIARSFLLLAGLASACSFDEREVFTSTSRLAPGADAGGSNVPGGPTNGGTGTPALALEPLALDFGAAVLGAPSRGRVSVLNGGDAPLDPVAAALAAGSDADYLILHNQCEGNVPPGGRCDIRLQLVPTKLGPLAGVLDVQSSGQGGEAALSASGLAAGPLTLLPAPGSSADFGGVVLGTSVEMVFDLSNPTPEGSGPLSISVNDAQFQLVPPVGADCQPGVSALVDGQRCSIRVAFTPTRRGPVDASLVVTSLLGGSSSPLVGVGRAPQALSTPDAVDFGGVVLGGIGQRTLLVENAGDEALQLTGVALGADLPAVSPEVPPEVPAPADAGTLAPVAAPAAPAGGAFSVQNSDCGAGKVLAGGESCSVTVGFRPLVAGADQEAEIAIGVVGGATRSIALRGSALSQGTLAIAAAAGADFGELLLGQTQTLQFVVSNPSAQPSGLLQIQTSDDFVALPSGAAGQCQSGVTSLVDGQSCAVSVNFTPAVRGQHDGSLLVSSALAGAAHQSLAGRGVAPARLDVARTELDFGRVPTETTVLQALSVINRGGQPIASLQATLVDPGGGTVSAFSLQEACSGPLAPGAACDLGLQFLPVAASNYAAVLELAGDLGGTASTLLLGQAFPRGNLVVAAAEGTTDFGDVALGSSRLLSFTLTNPGSVPSGRISLATSSNAFTSSEGDCNVEGSAGLVNGSSCSFDVTFTPATSDALVVNLSVQSPGAGETALSLTGRGRTAPSITATGNRDFGSANVNEQALTSPANQFTWTVTNDGDLDTGALAVENTNAAEFIVSNDTCVNVSVPGHGTCTMDIRFLPSGGGARAASLTVTDTVSSQSLVLEMTGNGTVIAGPGESCVNATCATGECTGGVCCDRACVGSCQVCSAAGVCTDQAERQACGDGSGVCFGVNQCFLPEREACSGGDQCGSGFCEVRLGGQGPADLICCLGDCGAGQECNPQTGQCQVPALGAGAACGAAGQPACAAGLECKPCLTGGSQCTPPDACCGGCQGELVCTGGECECPTPPGALQQIPCGGGRCIPNVAGACCDTATGCDGELVCAATELCACPAGSRECAAGSGDCVPNAQCCNCGGPCNQCVNGQCLPIGNGQPGQCTGGQVCLNGACGALADVQLGQACNQTANNCAAGFCNAQGICVCGGNDPKQCGAICIAANACCTGEECGPCGTCTAQRTCQGCPNGLECQGGTCAPPAPVLLGLGVACGGDGECESGQCLSHWADSDGDGFAPEGAPPRLLCASNTFVPDETTRTNPTPGFTDCDDRDVEANPNATAFFERARVSGGFDFNCRDGEEKNFQTVITDETCSIDALDGECSAQGIGDDTVCGEIMVAAFCVANGATSCGIRVADGIGVRACR